MNYLVKIQNKWTDEVRFHTLYAANEGVASCIAENLVAMLGDDLWEVTNVQYIDDEWPI